MALELEFEKIHVLEISLRKLRTIFKSLSVFNSFHVSIWSRLNFSHFLHEFHWLSQAIKHNGWCEQILQHVHVIVHVLAFNEKKMRVACDFVVNFLWEWWIRLEFLIEQMSIFDKKCNKCKIARKKTPNTSVNFYLKKFSFVFL